MSTGGGLGDDDDYMNKVSEGPLSPRSWLKVAALELRWRDYPAVRRTGSGGLAEVEALTRRDKKRMKEEGGSAAAAGAGAWGSTGVAGKGTSADASSPARRGPGRTTPGRPSGGGRGGKQKGSPRGGGSSRGGSSETKSSRSSRAGASSSESESGEESSSSSDGETSRMPPIHYPPAGSFAVGDAVEVLSRTWPGSNKPGGTGHVCGVGEGGTAYDIKYALGGREKGVDFKWVRSPSFLTPAAPRACNTKKRD